MRLRTRLERLAGPSAVAIGNFDGFHAGHRRIIETLTAEAQRRSLAAVVLTFRPHPRVFFGQPIRLISTDAQRLESLRRQALDRLFFIDFAAVAACPARDFVADILLRTLRLSVLVVGGDFRFGRDREGDLATLRRETGGRFTLIQAPDVEIDGCRVASSLIRKQLAAGAVRQAGRLLEKPYFIDGRVVRGAGRGRTLGFPTLNIASENAILPPGVFHTRVDIAGASYPALTNIGCAPTFGQAAQGPRIETHLPGFRRMVYGRKVRLHFIDKIRDERKFAGAGELAEQIRRDIASLAI
ncbi:MAG: riboflavin biosynthesis protein RibF [Acidobacteria bacterium]|jgi:riboflavin kinase/FMN adenylyltransferase|nr:riboflavin biosynthesis protein RibF [Acidobacteriota bacterium]